MSSYQRKTALYFRNKKIEIQKYFSNTATNANVCAYKSFKSIPGPCSIPVFGTLYQYLPLIGKYQFDKVHINGYKKFKQFGPIVKEEFVPGVNVVWLFRPEDFEILFRNEGKYPQRRSHLALQKYRLDRPNVYNTGGLLPTNGPEWWRLRSVFQKGLSSPQSVLNFIDCSNEVIEEWIQRLENLRDNQTNYLPELSRLFLEITGLTILDVKFGSFTNEELAPNSRTSQLIKAALNTNSSILKTDNGPQLWKKFETPLYRKLRKAQEFMESVAIDVINHKMRIFKDVNVDNRMSLLENYLASPELDMKDVIGIVCDFLLAGIDTSSYTTSFLLYHLALETQVQEKLYLETCKLLPKPDSPITAEILKSATYTKAVLKETLRMRPISVGIGRTLFKNSVFSGYEVPEGTTVVTQNQISCRLEEYFCNANKFLPERWLKNSPDYKPIHPFLVLPFGFGPRSCIARRLAEQTILILMLKLIRNYHLKWKGSELDIQTLLINKPNGPIALDIKKR